MKVRAIKMTDDQWELVKYLAPGTDQTASDWVRTACAEKAQALGFEWPDNPQHGGDRSKTRFVEGTYNG